jgi:RNA polymerase sigma factor (sigma-70 family)
MSPSVCDDPGPVVRRAAAGDQRAWRALVSSFDPLLRRVARSFRLSAADVDDVVQETWVRLFRSLHRLDDPDAVGGWLATTVRRESMRLLQRELRELPQADVAPDERGDVVDPLDEVAQAERDRVVRAAVERLGGRQQAVMTALLGERELNYHVVGRRLGMPVGSIGPTRCRAIERLRRDPGLVGILRDARRQEPVEADVVGLELAHGGAR